MHPGYENDAVRIFAKRIGWNAPHARPPFAQVRRFIAGTPPTHRSAPWHRRLNYFAPKMSLRSTILLNTRILWTYILYAAHKWRVLTVRV
jgi:hypothetical protein